MFCLALTNVEKLLFSGMQIQREETLKVFFVNMRYVCGVLFANFGYGLP